MAGNSSSDPLLDSLLATFDLSPNGVTDAVGLARLKGRREVIEFIASWGLPPGKRTVIKEVLNTIDVHAQNPKAPRPDRTGRSPKAS